MARTKISASQVELASNFTETVAGALDLAATITVSTSVVSPKLKAPTGAPALTLETDGTTIADSVVVVSPSTGNTNYSSFYTQANSNATATDTRVGILNNAGTAAEMALRSHKTGGVTTNYFTFDTGKAFKIVENYTTEYLGVNTSGKLSLTSNGTNQDVAITPSGTGKIIVGGTSPTIETGDKRLLLHSEGTTYSTSGVVVMPTTASVAPWGGPAALLAVKAAAGSGIASLAILDSADAAKLSMYYAPASGGTAINTEGNPFVMDSTAGTTFLYHSGSGGNLTLSSTSTGSLNLTSGSGEIVFSDSRLSSIEFTDATYNTLPGGATSLVGAINLAYNNGGSDAVLQFIVASGSVVSGEYIDINDLSTDATATFTLLGTNDFSTTPSSWAGGGVTESTFRRDIKLYVNGQLQTFEAFEDATPASYDFSRGSTNTDQVKFAFDLVTGDVVTIVATNV